VKFAPTLILISLLACGCNRNDARLTEQIVGTWDNEDAFRMTLSSNGEFSCGSVFSSNLSRGTWLIKNSALVMVITNTTRTKQQASGDSVYLMKIVQANQSNLTVEISGQTVYYRHK
jgi:hypothetical protein